MLKYKQKMMICTHSTSFHLLTRPFPGPSESEDIAKNNVLGTPESENIVQHSVFAFALTSPGALALLQAKDEITMNINRRELVLYKISRRRALFSASKSLNPYVDTDSSFLCCIPHNVHISTRTNIHIDIRIDTIFIYLQ